jgi:hypothetical protein
VEKTDAQQQGLLLRALLKLATGNGYLTIAESSRIEAYEATQETPFLREVDGFTIVNDSAIEFLTEKAPSSVKAWFTL